MITLLVLLLSLSASAEINEVSLIKKTIFGISYDIGMSPKVDAILHQSSALSSLHRASLEYYYPLYQYLNIGVSIDYTLAKSPKTGDARLDVGKSSSKISSTFLGVSPRIRPQLPINCTNFDLILYSEAQLGLGTSSPIAFGTQPLSDYTYENTSNFPTPFPLMLETTPKIGVAIFGWQFLGLDLAFGYRSLWIVHPMVSLPEDSLKDGMTKDKRKAIWYDVTSTFIQLGIKMAF